MLDQKIITWGVIIIVLGIGFWSAYKENKKEFKKKIGEIKNLFSQKKETMNIHGYKLKVQELKGYLKMVDMELGERNLQLGEKNRLIKKKGNILRKKQEYLNTIKSLKHERELRKNGNRQ